ncbi:Shikimate kinase I [hydrothermal vent metagenome]|uniref:shikimate kinase n=1 Tax=hydrothermal vent metagenome TaxID=652676 RepID=A0A3B0VYA8_9ZZZZ
MNIVLTGFMGVGKSAVGRRLASALGLDFVDTDELIEEQEGRSIAAIFEASGEPYFRGIEEQLVKGITSSMQGVVLSTGGGMVISPVNRELLAEWGTVVTLSAGVEEIVKRVGRARNRPLIDSAELRDSIERRLSERSDLYATAEHTVVTDGKSIDDVVEDIMALVKTQEGRA